MKNKINLVTGETYTLSELFSGERRIIVPDLQRDYCWGFISGKPTTGAKDLVSEFIRTLLEHSTGDKLNIGIIYGYESPANHVQLCDGQQRITTLYLLIGMLNRCLGENRFSRYLTPGDFVGKTLPEPYLQYAIRESSLYFLRDLLNDVFLGDDSSEGSGIGNVIKSRDWYFSDYDNDPSVQSMIGALISIESVLSKLDKSTMEALGRFVLNGLTLMYYDLENRSNGEETFVVINTAGEPLSPTENLKPLAIGSEINKNYQGSLADDWEEIETWFWRKRANGNDTADNGFNEFLRWVTILHYAGIFIPSGNVQKEEVQKILGLKREEKFSFPINEISFENIHKCWEKVQFLFDKWKFRHELASGWLSPANDSHIEQIDCFQLLPLIVWLLKRDAVVQYDDNRNLLRMHRFFENIARLEAAKSVNEVFCDAITLAAKYEDIVEAAEDTNVSNTILTEEERRKLRILSKSGEQRDVIEENFWVAQGNKILSGEIAPLLDWSTEGTAFDLQKFKRYMKAFCEVFCPVQKASLELVRRALLSCNLTGYPVRSGRNLSFCGENGQWKKVILSNSQAIQNFLDELATGIPIQSIIDRCEPTNKWFDIAREGCLLDYCENKNVQEDHNQANEYWLIKKTYAMVATSIPIALLRDTRERFGANGFDYVFQDCIGFHTSIDGCERFFQRWISREKDEVYLYLMSDRHQRGSYIRGSNPQGTDELERYRCLKIPDAMTAEDVRHGMRELVCQCQCKENTSNSSAPCS